MSLKNITPPWTYEDIEKCYFSDFKNIDRDIKDTEGGRLWCELESLHECLFIFSSCANDLLDIISNFGHSTTKVGFWNSLSNEKQKEYSNNVKKHLFCSAVSAMALVDHARKFKQRYPVDEYQSQLKLIFGNDGIHDFIQGLRNFSSHFQIAETNWQITYENNVNNVSFLLNKNDLLTWGSWKTSARSFILANDEEINIYYIFSEYIKKTVIFYNWHKYAVISKYSTTITQHLTHVKWLGRVKSKTVWNMIINHIPKDKYPYTYLDKYLTKEQVDDVFSYPYKSKEQIDRLIKIIDVDEICDEFMRQKIYLKLAV